MKPLALAGTVAFMPFAVPFMIEGLSVSAWTIAKPLLTVVLLPLAVGMAVLRVSPAWPPNFSLSSRRRRALPQSPLQS
jgi:predicted Na+-dependent transporter